MSEELTLIVVVGEMDEAIAIVTTSVKHKMISNKMNVCMHILVLESVDVLMTGVGVLMTGVGVTLGSSVTMS